MVLEPAENELGGTSSLSIYVALSWQEFPLRFNHDKIIDTAGRAPYFLFTCGVPALTGLYFSHSWRYSSATGSDDGTVQGL